MISDKTLKMTMFSKIFKKIIKYKFHFIALFLSMIGLFRWLSLSIFNFSDWEFYFKETSRDWLFPSTWITPHYSLGNLNLQLWKTPFNLIYGLFGLNSNLTEKFLIMWPIILIIPLFSFLLIKKIVKSDIAALIGSFCFSYNTYFLAINTQGHLTLTIAAGYSVLAIFLLIKTLEDKKIYFSILSSIILFIVGSYDMRTLYITTWLLIFYTIYFILFIDTNSSYRTKIKILIYPSLSVIILMLLNFYWIFTLYSATSLTNNSVLSRSLFGSGYWNIQSALTLFHPFWNGVEPIWFVTQPIPVYFWLIPIFAFLGLLLNNKNKNIIFFGLISLIGILLSKQTGKPFSNLYFWLYSNLPGFGAFREASKFYFIIALGYSILIGGFISWFWNKKFETKREIFCKYLISFIIAFIFLFNVTPLLTGKIGSLYVKRNIPNDYLVLKDFIKEQDGYFRTLWVPTDSHWGFYDYDHPKLGMVDIIQSDWQVIADYHIDTIRWPQGEQISNVLIKSFSNYILDSSSIKYIIIPTLDKKNNDNVFIYYANRSFFVNKMDNLSNFQKIEIGIKNINIYENKGYYPHIYVPENIYLTTINELNNVNFDENEKNAFIFIENPNKLPDLISSKIKKSPQKTLLLLDSTKNNSSSVGNCNNYGKWNLSESETSMTKNDSATLLASKKGIGCTYFDINRESNNSLFLLNITYRTIQGNNARFGLWEPDYQSWTNFNIPSSKNWITKEFEFYSKSKKPSLGLFADGNEIDLTKVEFKDIKMYEIIPNMTFTSHIKMKTPSINFVTVNPTKHVVSVQNSTNPFVLVFSEAYHPEWKVYVKQKGMKEGWIDALRNKGQEPFKINEWANGYYINNCNGSCTITLYFRPQSYFYLGSIISVTTLILCIVYLVYLPMKNKKNKKNAKK